ncbi:hypothetical protein ACHAP5_000848 [Fusarium lateritium]
MMRVSRQAFSTASRIHPNIVPHLHPQKRMSFGKVVKPIAAVVAVGYGAKLSLDMVTKRRIAQMEATERENAAYRERNEALMNMYGDRSSLDELEKAIQYYEKR